MDPEYGLPALRERANGTGVLLAYEKSGYDADPENRMPDVLDHWTVRRLVEAGADALKGLGYYDPLHDQDLTDPKDCVLERIGAQCACPHLRLFLQARPDTDSVYHGRLAL